MWLCKSGSDGMNWNMFRMSLHGEGAGILRMGSSYIDVGVVTETETHIQNKTTEYDVL